MTTVMAGALRDFDVPSILQAVSLSRQHTVLRLWDRSKRDTGEIRLKAGQLLGAACGSEQGREAFHAILRSKDHHSFRVDRLDDSVELPEPVGPVASLLLSVSRVEDEVAAKPSRAPKSSPPPPVVAATQVPPPPVPISAPVPVSPASANIRPRAVPRTISAVGAELAGVAQSIAPLEGLLLAKLPDCLLCKSWQRSETGPSADVLASYVAQVVQAHRACMQGLLPTSGEPTLTLELPIGSIMIEPISAELIAVYVFQATAPLGLIRILVSQFHTIISDRARRELFEGASRSG